MSSPALVALAPSLPGMPLGAGAAAAAALAVPIAGTIYALLFWGQRSTTDCAWRDDDQIGLKVILGTLIMVGTALFAGGLQSLLHLLLTFNDFGARIKNLLPDLIVGVGVLAGAIVVAVPKTNHEQQPKVLRLTAGAITLIAAVSTVVGLDTLLDTLFNWDEWKTFAGSLTSVITTVLVFGASGYLYAKMIGIEVPDIQLPETSAAPAGQPVQQQQQAYQQPAQQGYQQPAQPSGGYPQQGQQQQQQAYQQPAAPAPARPGAPPRPGGGGYPPPPGGGGYPPSGGGYPPS